RPAHIRAALDAADPPVAARTRVGNPLENVPGVDWCPICEDSGRRDGDWESVGVIEDVEQVRAVIAGSPLEGLIVRDVELFDGVGRVFVIDIEQRDVLQMWSAARALVSTTGRAPCVLATWGEAEVGADRFRPFAGEFGGLSAEQVIERAEAMGAEDAATWFRDRYSDYAFDVWDSPYGPESDVERALAETHRRLGLAPSEGEVREGIGEPASEESLERWLLTWELTNGAEGGDDPGHLEWCRESSVPTSVVLLDSTNTSDALALSSFWANESSEDAVALLALVRSWNRRFGAELVAHYGTMLKFIVERPPSSIDDAFQLACEQYWVAPCTTALPGVSLRDHARALLDRPTWFMHERP
ncbi:MAG: DUF4253 domain-containing protein, partial [Actinomycetota bacterium]